MLHWIAFGAVMQIERSIDRFYENSMRFKYQLDEDA